uniref:Retrotransposable element Tf2 n=1 Tax=Tanacetum cinerariifolium TaxID=118510 RepID=A0A6L2M8F1_TANCI|nr:retrotransposable element Tf2 [Tanacetum cinerariifolium]
MLKFHLRRAQDRMKAIADGHRTDRQYAVGDMVYLKLQPYRQTTVRQGLHHKLSSKFYGPFQVLEKIGELKKCKTEEIAMGNFPTCTEDGLIAVEPVKILDRRMQKRGNSATVYVLVQWANGGWIDMRWEGIAVTACERAGFLYPARMYYLEYTLKNPGESERHLVSVLGIANNGWYNRLYTVTGQYLDDESEKYRTMIEKAVASFKLV